MALDASPDTNPGQLALRLLRIEQELASFRELHEQELRALEDRVQSLRVALAHMADRETATTSR